MYTKPQKDTRTYVPIKNYEHEYKIASDGTVVSKLTNMYLKPVVNGKGYLTVTLSKDGKRRIYQLHVLVAKHFLPNPDNLPVVNHLDGITTHPDVSNLEWTTHSGNTLHAHRTGLQTKTSNKRVMREDGVIYETLTDAAKANQTSKNLISMVASGKRKSTAGHTFKYVERREP